MYSEGHLSGDFHKVVTMKLDSDVSGFVGTVIAKFITLAINIIIDLLLGGVAFYFSNSNSMGALGLDRFLEMLPQVAVGSGFPVSIVFSIILNNITAAVRLIGSLSIYRASQSSSRPSQSSPRASLSSARASQS